MNSLKIQIESLFEEWDLEIKEEHAELNLLIIRSKFNCVRSEPKVWAASWSDSTFLPEIHQWIHRAAETPHRPRQITISDGTRFTITYAADGKEYTLVISDFEENTNEYNLVEKLLDSCVKLTGAPELIALRDRWKNQELNRTR